MSVRSNSPATRNFPILCYVTDRRGLPLAAPSAEFSALLQKITQLASVGVDWVQIREKDLSARQLAALTRGALRCMPGATNGGASATRILVNDRVDIALTEGAAGVHLGESSSPVDEVRHFVSR